jgi:hypothetical protein
MHTHYAAAAPDDVKRTPEVQFRTMKMYAGFQNTVAVRAMLTKDEK